MQVHVGASLVYGPVSGSVRIHPLAPPNALVSTTVRAAPRFEGGSTAVPTVSGVYDGARGTQRLTVHMVSAADRTVGGDRSIKLRMFDEQGFRIETVTIAAGAAAGTAARFGNGIAIALSDGIVKRGDRIEIDVGVDAAPLRDVPSTVEDGGASSLMALQNTIEGLLRATGVGGVESEGRPDQLVERFEDQDAALNATSASVGVLLRTTA